MKRRRPIVFVWNGEAMVPLPYLMKECDDRFVIGEQYPMEPVEQRSQASHRSYFASVHEAWKNLAEEFDGRFPDSEHLRKWALVQTGFATCAEYVMDSEHDARLMAAFVRKSDKYAVIRVKGTVVQVFVAESQAVPAMKEDRFEASSRAVLDLVSSMARSTPAQLRKNAGKSA